MRRGWRVRCDAKPGGAGNALPQRASTPHKASHDTSRIESESSPTKSKTKNTKERSCERVCIVQYSAYRLQGTAVHCCAATALSGSSWSCTPSASHGRGDALRGAAIGIALIARPVQAATPGHAPGAGCSCWRLLLLIREGNVGSRRETKGWNVGREEPLLTWSRAQHRSGLGRHLGHLNPRAWMGAAASRRRCGVRVVRHPRVAGGCAPHVPAAGTAIGAVPVSRAGRRGEADVQLGEGDVQAGDGGGESGRDPQQQGHGRARGRRRGGRAGERRATHREG